MLWSTWPSWFLYSLSVLPFKFEGYLYLNCGENTNLNLKCHTRKEIYVRLIYSYTVSLFTLCWPMCDVFLAFNFWKLFYCISLTQLIKKRSSRKTLINFSFIYVCLSFSRFGLSNIHLQCNIDSLRYLLHEHCLTRWYTSRVCTMSLKNIA